MTLGVIERKGTIKISLLGSRSGRSWQRRLQNQTKTTTNGQLTLFCLTAPQIKKKINSTTAILDRTYSRVTNSNKVHSTSTSEGKRGISARESAMCARGRCSREPSFHIPYKHLPGRRPVANLFANIFNNNNNNTVNKSIIII